MKSKLSIHINRPGAEPMTVDLTPCLHLLYDLAQIANYVQREFTSLDQDRHPAHIMAHYIMQVTRYLEPAIKEIYAIERKAR